MLGIGIYIRQERGLYLAADFSEETQEAFY
jgi:hypothetical protein